MKSLTNSVDKSINELNIKNEVRDITKEIKVLNSKLDSLNEKLLCPTKAIPKKGLGGKLKGNASKKD